MKVICAKFIYKNDKLNKVEVLADYTSLTVCKPLTDVRAILIYAEELVNIKPEKIVEYAALYGFQIYPKNIYEHFGVTRKEVEND